jgi:nicotinate-nucleotide pyrophosphorylase (carboxylating)
VNLDKLLDEALDEDLGHGDLTTEACIPVKRLGHGRVVAKQDLVLAGVEAAGRVFPLVADRIGVDRSEVRWEIRQRDGEAIRKGGEVAEIIAPMRVILIGERLALNLLMKLSGVATYTRRYADAAGGSLRVIDTRKTTPLLRDLEKYAVRCGGGYNHRFGLFDGVLVKDNHVDAVGSLKEAVRRARDANHHLVRVQVEVRTPAELEEALDSVADAVLLDNMDDAGLAACVKRIREKRPAVLVEASGTMTVERITGLRGIGLDYVSVGALIHQAVWADLSLKVR